MLKKNAIKIKLYRYAILHSKNCIVTIKNKSKPEEIKITRGNIALIEKNIEAVVEIDIWMTLNHLTLLLCQMNY